MKRGKMSALNSTDKSYKGSTLVWIKGLQPHGDQTRELDHKSVARRREIFSEQGCRRKEREKDISVIIDESALLHAIQDSGITEELLMNHPANKPPTLFARFRYLNGQHRLAAAKQFLAKSEQ